MTEEQTAELLSAACMWRSQGSRTKWSTPISRKLWDTVDKIEKELGIDKQLSLPLEGTG